jgi:hypothetical protein
MKPGKSYEIFVGKLHKALIESETLFNQKNIEIVQGKKIVDLCGIEREFDLYWEYEFAGMISKTVIECKDYSSPISIEKIDALIGKLHDLPGIKPVFATTIGYQSGAKIKAEKNGIELLIVREQNDSDWYDKNGTPYIKEINIEMVLHSDIYVTEIRPFIDKEWLVNNTTKKIEDFQNHRFESVETTKIDDKKNNTLRTVMSYLEEINGKSDEEFGNHEIKYTFDDAYLIFDDERYKLKYIEIVYNRPAPTTMPIKIDYSKELLGIIEYLSRNEKVSVFSNGKIFKEKMI